MHARTQTGRRIALTIALAMLPAMLTSCASGMTRAREAQAKTAPDLVIPAAQLAEPTPHLVPLTSTADRDVLGAHAMDSRMYHALVIQLQALQCTVLNLAGVTINGAKPTPRESCTDGESDSR